MRTSIVAATMALILLGTAQVQADGMAKTELKSFDVTIRVFDPTKGLESGHSRSGVGPDKCGLSVRLWQDTGFDGDGLHTPFM